MLPLLSRLFDEVGMWFVVHLINLVILAMIVTLGLHRPSEDDIAGWARSYGVVVDGENRAIVLGYLTRTRRLRFGLAFLAWFGQSFVRSWVGQPIPWATSWVFLVAGYLLGAVIAEATLRAPVGAMPSAVLSPRTITSYVPRYGIVALVALPVVSAGLVAFYAGIPMRPQYVGSGDATVMAVAAASGAVFAILVGLTMRAIVRRPQPAASGGLVELDDAFRSSSLHALNGATVTLELLLLAYMLGQTQSALSATHLHSLLQTVLSMLALFAMVMAVASWAVLGHPSAWRTRRPRALAGSR